MWAGRHARGIWALRLACLVTVVPSLKIDSGAVWQSVDQDHDGVEHASQFGWKPVRRSGHDHSQVLTDGQGYRQVMRNFGDTQYLSYFTLGGQTMAGILDTGSFELVVFSKVCASCGKASRYDPSLSATHRAGTMFAGQFYGSGETWSQDASDQMLLGPYRVNQSFWEVSKAKMPVLLASEFHAIVGLGPPETPAKDAWEAAARSAHNVSEVLSTVGEVDNATVELARDKARIAVAMGKRSTALKTMNENMFSVCIGKDPGSEGVLIWNDTSAALYPELFHKVPVIGRNSWSVKAHNARLAYVKNATESRPTDGPEADGEEESFHNSTSIDLGCGDGCGVLLDSGTSLLAVPHTVINRLVQLIASPKLNCSNMWELPHLVFDLNGKTFSLPPDVYVSEVSYAVPSYMQSFVRLRHLGTEAQRPGRRCDLLVMESYAKSDPGPLWIFGMPFFRKYYTSFAVGLNASERALHLAGSSPACTPTKRRVEVHDGPPDMWKRIIDPTQLWMPSSVQLAATTQHVRL